MKTLRSLLTLLLFLTSPATFAADAKRPNVVVLLADDQGWGDLSFNGNTNISTPNIDSLGKKGAVLERFFVCPVCSPTRAEVLTGRWHPRGRGFGEHYGFCSGHWGDYFDAPLEHNGEIVKGEGYIAEDRKSVV